MERFHYDHSLGATAEELARSCQFTAGVRVGGSRLLRTRVRYDLDGAGGTAGRSTAGR